MSFILGLPNGEILFTILIIGAIGLAVTSVGALLRIWTWKTPQSIMVLIVGAIVLFLVANYSFEGTFLG